MAKFDIPGNYDRVTKDFFNQAFSNQTSKIRYTQGTGEIFIYCNHPEYLEDIHLGDANPARYINRVEVSNKRKMLIYITHHLERLRGSYKLGIRVYNPSSTKTVNFIKRHEGYSNKYDWSNPGFAWEDFFTNKSGSLSLKPRTSNWLAIKDITNTGNSGGSFLDYIGEFDVDNPFYIAVYICRNINNMPDSANVISPAGETQSGYAECYSLQASETLDMAGALTRYGNSFFFGISNPYGNLGATEEKIPIYLVQGGKTTEQSNIGNYGLQYKLQFTFKNTSNTPLKVKAYIISNHASHFVGLASSNGASKFLNSESPGSANRWNFYNSGNLTKTSSQLTIDFTYCHLALGSRGAILQFEAVRV